MELSTDDFFAALANPVRLRSLILLTHFQELCVCELMHALGMSQPMISRHLAQLRKVGLVKDRREGQWIYYRLSPSLPAWASDVLKTTASGVKQTPPYDADHAALEAMPNRPGAPCCA
jgi:ArsR family transcriptional regulator